MRERLKAAGLREDRHGDWWSDAEADDGEALALGNLEQAYRWAVATGRVKP